MCTFYATKKKEFEQFVKEDIQVLKRVANTKYILVCPQTFSHTVMCKVCLTASNTLFDSDAFVRLNHWIRIFGDWDFKLCRLIKLAEHIFLNSRYNLLAIDLAGFSANLRTRKLRLMSRIYKNTISVRGASSLNISWLYVTRPVQLRSEKFNLGGI